MLGDTESDNEKYQGQHRGNADAYQRYLSGMDRSMRQKVALTAAHLLGEGTVADMGMGSGSGTLALASLYPRVKVIGVDINPEMVSRAANKHTLPNLEFRTGDIAEMVFAPESLDGIFDSSVLHHVTSFTGYDHAAAARALRNQVRQLARGGSLIVRDFVAPSAGDVWLDLPNDDGEESSDPTRCSSAALFERFAREFRKLSPEPGFVFERVPAHANISPQIDANWRRYLVDHHLAAEFLLRKDYRNDWDTEILEEYTYFTQQKFESTFAELGLRVLASIPLHNPWIVQHRFRGKAKLFTLSGDALPFPATNHLIAAEKVHPGDGVRFIAGELTSPVGFLRHHSYTIPATGAHRDLLRRPGHALDVVPWFRDRGAVYVLARKGYPRPVLLAPEATQSRLDGAHHVGYVTEPILVMQSDMPLGLTIEAELQHLAGISPAQVLSLREAATYYPSPGGIAEEVRAVHVEIEPTYVQRELRNATGFSSSGTVRAMDAHQVLRAAQVGALPDARLELNVYELLLREGLDVGPWIGAEIAKDPSPSSLEPTPFTGYTLPQRRGFAPHLAENEQAPFLELKARWFSELDATGSQIHRQVREYVVPRTRSCNTVSAAVLCHTSKGPALGLDEDDLAACQCFTGSSALWVTPAWRIPCDITSREAAEVWLAERLLAEYGQQVSSVAELGGRYHPSAGVTPEVVYPYAVMVRPVRTAGVRPLRWVLLHELVTNLERLPDGHLRIAVLRSAHALGVLHA